LVTILTIFLFILLAVNSLRYFWRLDITSTQMNTISSVSRNLAKEIPEQVSIRYYISDKLRSLSPEPNQIIDILEEYAAYARGKILVEVVNTKGKEREIEQLGIAPQQIQVVEENEQSLAVVYTGIVIRYLARKKVFPLVFDSLSIEYQLTSSIRQLVQDDERIVGLMTAAESQELQYSYSSFREHIKENFKIRDITVREPIPDEVDVLVVVDNQNYDNDTLYYIDKYLVNGGSVLFASDGVDVLLSTQRGGTISVQKTRDSALRDLLAHYGIAIRENLLLDEQNIPLPVIRQAGLFKIQTFIDYPHWVHINSAVDTQHPITARFAGLDLFWPSELNIISSTSDQTNKSGKENQQNENGDQVNMGQDTTFSYSVLLASSDQSWLMQRDFAVNPEEVFRFKVGSDATTKSYPLVVAGYGKLLSYDKLLLPNQEEAKPVANKEKGKNASRLVVVADSDFLSDLTRVSANTTNFLFAENLLEWLSNDEDLLKIRSRSQRNLALDKINDPQKEKMLQVVVKWINLFLVPLSVVLTGIFLLNRRRNKNEKA